MIDTQRKGKQKYIIIFLLILILSTTFFIMYKYYVEGEKNMPFNITNMVMVSSAQTENIRINENVVEADVIQKNDIYIAIEKNKNYSKEDAIKKIIFNNFQIINSPKIGEVKFYRTAQTENIFEYTADYEIKESVEYSGSKETNIYIENMTIANQGGLLELSIVLKDLGNVNYLENDDIIKDGTILKKLNINNEDIKTTISFDMIMELVGGNTFKTTIKLELPAGDIISEGVITNEVGLDKLVYKRI